MTYRCGLLKILYGAEQISWCVMSVLSSWRQGKCTRPHFGEIWAWAAQCEQGDTCACRNFARKIWITDPGCRGEQAILPNQAAHPSRPPQGSHVTLPDAAADQPDLSTEIIPTISAADSAAQSKAACDAAPATVLFSKPAL